MRQHLMLTFFQLHPKHCVRQRFEDFCHNLYRLFLRHRHEFALAGKLRILTCGPSKRQAAAMAHAAVTSSSSNVGRTRVSTSGPSAVIATVCSKCALGWPATVTTVQPSFRVRVCNEPIFTMGSSAKT